MSLMITGLYDALKNAGATDDLAKQAAQEVASYENRLSKIEGDIGLLKWMVAFNIAMTATVMFKLFNLS